MFEKLDIESPEEFIYYENFEALMEEEEHIEEDLIRELLSAADEDYLRDQINSFFEGFISDIPDDENELSIIIDMFRNNISHAASYDMTDDAIGSLISEIYRFRKWYAIDHNAVDESDGSEISVRDARYEIAAARLLGSDADIDFGRALTGGPDSYSVRLRDIIE